MPVARGREAAGGPRAELVLLDYFPALKVIVGEGNRIRTVLITDLLPESHVWADHQPDAE